jgi:cell division septation protein DedD
MRGIIIMAGLALATPAVATVATGAEKWRAGDWDGAVAEWTAPAARGEPEALFNMGQAYRLGRGVPQSSKTALELYRQAAAKGHVAATTNLGITLWQEGRRAEALGFLRTAADRGDLRAAYVLGVATFSGEAAPRNPALGYAYVLRARDGGLAAASAQAARMATMMTPDARARGEAAAAALAAGRPVAVVMADLAAEAPRPTTPVEAAGADDSEDDAEAAPARKPADGRGRATEQSAALADEVEKAAAGTPPKGKAKAGAGAKEKPAKAEAKAEAEAETEGFKVQLGAYANERAARTAWATLVSQSADLLKGAKPLYAPRGGLVRLQVGPFETRKDASSLCTKLAAAGRPCFVTEG